MVATLLKIQFRVLGNTLVRNPWQLVGFILGGLWAAGFLVVATIGLFFAGGLGIDGARYTIIAAGAVLTFAWVVAPVFATGIDTTLDPAKLAPFPLTSGRMMVALTVAGTAGIPGLATLLGGIATFAVWWRWPVAAAAAVVCVPLGVAICVVASRTVAALAAGLGGERRAREIIALLAFAALVLASPLIIGLLNLVRSASEAGIEITSILEAISWTPIAAAWAVPGDLAAGSPLTALVKAAIAAVTLAALWALWHRSLAAALVAPAGRSSSRRSRSGNLGWFGRLPNGGAGATWARSLTYWMRDGRYLRQLLLVPLMPALVLFYTGGDLTHGFFVASALVVAFFIGIVPYADISYDGTAFGTVLQTGIRGRSDRIGRTLGAASLGAPLVVIVAVVTVGLAGRWDALPAVLGASLGLLLTGYGVCAISSAVLVIPVPAPGDNPFKRVPGATFTMGLAFMGLWLATALLALPEIILATLALVTGDALFTWLALAVGLVLGGVIVTVGVIVGGRVLDRNAPALLARLKSLKGA